MNKLELSILSDHNNLDQVEHFIEELITTFKVPQQQQSDLMLAITEATNIIMQHSGRPNVSPSISFRAIRSRQKITVEVEQEGAEFDDAHPPKPLATTNAQGLSGRNIYNLVTLTDELSFTRKGARIVMSIWMNK